MLHKKVKHEAGLAIVMGAFAAAFLSAGIPALKFQAAATDAIVQMQAPYDTDGDGIADEFDAFKHNRGPRSWNH